MPDQRPRGFADWQPYAKTKILLGQVQDVIEEYEDHLPLTVRQIFYRLVGAHEYDKTERAYERLLNMLIRARRARIVDFDAIRDDGAVADQDYNFASVEDFFAGITESARTYRRDRQAGQSVHIELWCEAAGMMPQLARVAHRYSVPVYSGSGFDSLTAKYEAARRALARDVPTVILHVGDYDPSGRAIFDSAVEDVAAFAEDQYGTVEGLRVALTEEQVERYALPTVPPKASDRRSKGWTQTCQAEALAPDVLAELITEAIEAQLDLDVLDEIEQAEAAERATILRTLARDET